MEVLKGTHGLRGANQEGLMNVTIVDTFKYKSHGTSETAWCGRRYASRKLVVKVAVNMLNQLHPLNSCKIVTQHFSH